MKPSELLRQNRTEIRRIAMNHRVRDIRLFGSVLRGEDSEASDLDLLVLPTDKTSLFDIGAIQCEISELLGISVDVLTPNALPEGFRDEVLGKSEPV